MVKMILCVDKKGNIGRNNDLLFKMKEDMKFFKETTKGNIVVMGYNTWLSLGKKALPNRINVVLTKKDIYSESKIFVSKDLRRLIEDYRESSIDNDLFIIGGASVYNQALEMELVDEILITIVPLEVMDADVKVNMELMKEFNNKKILDSFVSESGIKVTIESWKK